MLFETKNSKDKNIIIKANHISKIFLSGGVELKAINNISFKIRKGELTIILGPSGAGKSTLLNLLGGMDNVSEGELLVNNKDIAKEKEKGLTLYRRYNVGFVFQFYNLMPNLTALENVELATELNKKALDPKKVLSDVGLANRINNFPGQLSGGEQQRVSIARAIAKNPDILLCDEPTGALDYQTGKNILKLLANLVKQEHKTIIIVTHNSSLEKMGHHIIKLKNGEIVSDIRNKNVVPIEDIEW